MVDRVRVPPVAVRHQRHHAEHAPDRVVQARAAEERAVAAVVLEDEEPDVESRDRKCHQQHQPVVPVEPRADGHGAPPCDQEQARRHQLEPRATVVGSDKRRHQLPQPGLCNRQRRIRVRRGIRHGHGVPGDPLLGAVKRGENLRQPKHASLHGSTHATGFTPGRLHRVGPRQSHVGLVWPRVNEPLHNRTAARPGSARFTPMSRGFLRMPSFALPPPCATACAARASAPAPRMTRRRFAPNCSASSRWSGTASPSPPPMSSALSRPRTRLLERLDENERVLIETFDMLTAAVQVAAAHRAIGRMAARQLLPDRRADPHGPAAPAQGIQPGTSAPGAGPVPGPAARLRHRARGHFPRRRPGRLAHARALRDGLPVRHAAHAGRAVGHPDHVAACADREPAPRQRPDHATARMHASEAQRWADQMTEIAESDPKSLILVIADMARSNPPMVEPVRRGTRAPPPGPRSRARVAAHLGRAAARRIEPDDRTDGAVGDPAAGGGPGFGQQHDREPALAGRDGLARVRRVHESRRAGAARGPAEARTA